MELSASQKFEVGGFVKRNFKTNLSQKGIAKTISKLEDYRKNTLQQKANLIATALANHGVAIAKLMVVKYDAVFTEELFSSIRTRLGYAGNGTCICYVVADSKHAVFVEFGTGQIGSEAPYPYPMPDGFDWQYNIGQTIFEVAPGEYGWFYQRDGQTYFTQGMPSRPFMYETAKELQSRVVKIVKQTFKY